MEKYSRILGGLFGVACGDADTIGAITGGLAGVYYDVDSVPERWREKILVKDKLMEIAEKVQELKSI